MSAVKDVPSLGWTRRSVAFTVLSAMDEYRREIGHRVAAYRDSANLTQEELAHAAGTSVKTVSRLENGRHEPELSTLRKFADALGVEVQDLQGKPPAPLGLGQPTQLDRIEQKLDQVLDALASMQAQDSAHKDAAQSQRTRTSAGRRRSA